MNVLPVIVRGTGDMPSCSVDNCHREYDQQGLCFFHRIRTVAWAKGHLRNDLYPDLTIRESQKKIVEDAARNGYEAVPVSRGAE